MAMDRERLFTYFQEHYLSRQEVLARLPLNIPIDGFWTELVSRRKANAVYLPLSDSRERPYWYVLTPRMIHDSEILAEEAMQQQDMFDPYLARMTSAMTEEMFFTSYVEGAQISLQDAMDFLQRGTEPQDVQEQMILNNRSAWSAMISSLYHPLDERFIKSLAYMLTENMDECAMDYRSSDTHEIAAMQMESYEVPQAVSIPGKMQQFYRFLQDGQVHPLIKSAVGQAYMLVLRPFPEGNERLSRMISSAVLLRGGYDFFRDISLSGIIARENYRYYKSMQEILRTENGGDLTYFIEYFLDLLIRALEEKKRREERINREQLAQERVMAMQPLSHSDQNAPGTTEPKENPAIDDRISSLSDVFPDPATESIPGSEMNPKSGDVQEMQIAQNGTGKAESFPDDHPTDHDVLSGETEDDSMICLDLTQPLFPLPPLNEGGKMEENKAESGPARSPASGEKSTTDQTESEEAKFELMRYEYEIMKLETSSVPKFSNAGRFFHQLLDTGHYQFTKKDLQDSTGLSDFAVNKVFELILEKQLAVKTSLFRNRSTVYHLNVSDASMAIICSRNPIQQDLSHQQPSPNMYMNNTDHITKEMFDTFMKMATCEENPRLKRLGTFMLDKIDMGVETLTILEYSDRFQLSKSTLEEDIRYAVAFGLLEKTNEVGKTGVYRICDTQNTEARTNNLSMIKKRMITALFQQFGSEYFTLQDIADRLGMCKSTIQFHIKNLKDRGIIETHNPGPNVMYSITVAPTDHPECFASDDDPILVLKQAMPGMPKLDEVILSQHAVDHAS